MEKKLKMLFIQKMENSRYDDIEIHDSDEFYIQGVAVKIIRDLDGEN